MRNAARAYRRPNQVQTGGAESSIGGHQAPGGGTAPGNGHTGPAVTAGGMGSWGRSVLPGALRGSGSPEQTPAVQKWS